LDLNTAMERPMRTVDWYFDFISPYAYLAWHRLPELPADVHVVCKPVLFAALLDHWGQKGPAEIAPKRLWTYRWCQWRAQRDGVPLRAPAAHPFNPLPQLRLALAAGCAPAAIQRIFESVWATGEDAADPAAIVRLSEALGVAPERSAAPEIKEALRRNTAEAAARGVFGVPTLAIDGEIFWGVDGMDLAMAFLADPAILRNEEMQRIAALPVGVARKAVAAPVSGPSSG
jgi:2-hydroxychromene-2-carboxylate isomerase